MSENTSLRIRKSKSQLSRSILASFTGTLGSSIFSFSLGLMLLEKTGLSISFGLSIMITALIGLFLSPLVGPLVDKISRKFIILASQSIVIIALLGYIFMFNSFNQHILIPTILLMVVLAVTDDFTSTAQESSKINVVLEDDLQKLAGYQELTENMVGLFSAVMGALLYAILPFNILIMIEIILELTTFLLTATLNFKFNKSSECSVEENSTTSNWKLFIDGLLYLKRQPYLVIIMVACMLINFFYTIIFVGLPSLMLKSLETSSIQYGMTQGALSLGTIVGAYLLTRRQESQTPVYNLMQLGKILPILFIGIGSSIFIHSQLLITIWISLLMLLIGFSSSTLNIPFAIWLQKHVPTNLQGRVFHLLSVLSMCIQPLGILIYGLLFDLKVTSSAHWDSIIFISSGIILYAIVLIYTNITRKDLKHAQIY